MEMQGKHQAPPPSLSLLAGPVPCGGAQARSEAPSACSELVWSITATVCTQVLQCTTLDKICHTLSQANLPLVRASESTQLATHGLTPGRCTG